MEQDFTEEEEVNVASHEEEIEGEGLDDYLKPVIESPSRVLVRDFFTSADLDFLVPLPNCGFSS